MLWPGSFFGEIALILRQRRSASIRAKSRADYFTLTKRAVTHAPPPTHPLISNEPLNTPYRRLPHKHPSASPFDPLTCHRRPIRNDFDQLLELFPEQREPITDAATNRMKQDHRRDSEIERVTGRSHTEHTRLRCRRDSVWKMRPHDLKGPGLG